MLRRRVCSRKRPGVKAGDVKASPRFCTPRPRGSLAERKRHQWGVKRRGGAFTRQPAERRGAHCGSQGGSHRDGGEARSEMARMAATMEHDEDAEKLKLGPGVLLNHHAICAHDTC